MNQQKNNLACRNCSCEFFERFSVTKFTDYFSRDIGFVVQPDSDYPDIFFLRCVKCNTVNEQPGISLPNSKSIEYYREVLNELDLL